VFKKSAVLEKEHERVDWLTALLNRWAVELSVGSFLSTSLYYHHHTHTCMYCFNGHL